MTRLVLPLPLKQYESLQQLPQTEEY
jgi:hypothetical protein